MLVVAVFIQQPTPLIMAYGMETQSQTVTISDPIISNSLEMTESIPYWISLIALYVADAFAHKQPNVPTAIFH